MRSALKSAAEALAVSSGATRAVRRMRRSQAVVLAYHNVVPDGNGGRGQTTLHVPVSRFRRQIDRLSETHRIVSVADLLDGSAWMGGADRPLAAVTFDDAYSGAVTLGVPELVAREIPATLFVSPGLLGGHTFWWDVLADGRGGVLSDSLMVWALEKKFGDHRRILGSPEDHGIRSPRLPGSLKSATADEVEDAASSPGITVGSHGWSHLNLASLSEENLERELRRPLEWLGDRWDSVLPVLSYPYGSSSPHVEKRAEMTGYAAGFQIDGGWLAGRPTGSLDVPRINVPAGASLRRFEISTSGLWPVA